MCTPRVLVLRKPGEIPPVAPNIRTVEGVFFEDGIRQLYSWVTGRPTRKVGVSEIYDDTIRCTIDAECTEERRGVEIKRVHWDQREKWRDGLPDKVICQIQTYMEFKGLPVFDVAAYIGEDLHIFTEERDRELGERLRADALEFVELYIRGTELPPIDGSEEVRDWLKQRFPRHRAELRTATAEEIGWLNEYCELRRQQKTLECQLEPLEKRREVLENQLREAVAEDAGLRWKGGQFTWKRTKDRSITNWEELAQHLLDGFSEEEKAGYVHEYTESQPGARRIWLRDLEGI
jgi:predicted phage-related endonuclease